MSFKSSVFFLFHDIKIVPDWNFVIIKICWVINVCIVCFFVCVCQEKVFVKCITWFCILILNHTNSTTFKVIMVNLIKYDSIKSTATSCLLDGPHDFNCAWMSYGWSLISAAWLGLQLSLFPPVFFLCVPVWLRALWVSCPNVWPYWNLYPVDKLTTFHCSSTGKESIISGNTYSTVITIFPYLVCGPCRRAGDLFWRGILWVSEASWWTIPLVGWGRSDLTSFPCKTGSVPCWWWWDIQYQRGTGIWGHSQ